LKIKILLLGLACTLQADWYYHVMKITCSENTIKVINYSAYNEIGEARGKEPDAIDVDKLSTWKTTADELNIPDKSLPYIKVCTIPSGKYKIILTNAGGGYSAPYPVVNVSEISDLKNQKILIANLSLRDVVENKNEIIFSSEYPKGKVINE